MNEFRPQVPRGMPADIEHKKQIASEWFATLRDAICAKLEDLEDELEGPNSDQPPGRFERSHWSRGEGEGGRVSSRSGSSRA